MNPLVTQPNPPVAPATDQIGSQQRANVCENLRLTCRVEPMAPVVHRQPIDLEAAGVPADIVTLLEDDGLSLALRHGDIQRGERRRGRSLGPGRQRRGLVHQERSQPGIARHHCRLQWHAQPRWQHRLGASDRRVDHLFPKGRWWPWVRLRGVPSWSASSDSRDYVSLRDVTATSLESVVTPRPAR